MSRYDSDQLPEPIRTEAVDYIEHLLEKHVNEPFAKKRISKWADVWRRAKIEGESMSETVIRMREEERC